MNKMTEEELVENGLMGESYDQITRIRTRIRKINDIEMPVRGGIAPEQFGVGLVVFFISAIVFALIVRPLFSLFGISPHWLVTVTLLFAPPLLAAQRVIKPMRYEKSIPSSMKSWWRYVTDENTHARGLPIPARPQEAVGGPTLTYQRVWVPEEGLFEAEETDARTESFFDGDVVELGAWVTERAQAHRALFDAEREEARKSSVNASTTRSRGKSVILDESGAS